MMFKRFLKDLIFALSLAASSAPFYSNAEKYTPIKVSPEEVFSVSNPNGGTVSCMSLKNRYIAGTLKGNKFTPASYEMKKMQDRMKRVNNYRSLLKIEKKLTKLRRAVKDKNTLCSSGPTLTPTPTPTPSGPASSLNKLSRALTREDVRYLLEKAGFGLSAKEEYLVDIGVNQGVEALVTEFMRTRDEPAGLLSRVEDYRDGQLGTDTTQTPRGQREALLDLWIHTNNPYAEKLAFFLLSVWTVSGDVISDETYRFWFWDYFERLREYAYAETALPQLGVEISRDPLMLLYLNNNLNVRSNPNENYARELMELFTLGPENLDGAPNYTETQTDGSGDIAVAARMLTGWTLSYVRGSDGVNTLQAVYRATSHYPGPHTMFAGTANEFSGEDDEALVLGIFNNHAYTKNYYAKEILKEYVTPNPSRELIENFGRIIFENNYKLRPALAALFQSEAFYDLSYRDTVPKNSVEYAVEFIRTVAIEDAVNISYLESYVREMGMAFNDAPSVFWFDPLTWTGPSVILARANFIARIFGDSTAQQVPEPDWNPASVLPSGTTTTQELIAHVAEKLGVGSLSTDQIASLDVYMNQVRNYDGSYSSQLFDNTNSTIQRRKGLGVYYILAAGTPAFQLK